MTLFIAYLLFSFLIAFLTAPKIIGFLYRKNVRKRAKVDLDSLLSSHREKVGVPLMGGLIVILPAIFISLFFVLDPRIAVLVAVLIAGGLIGMADDLLTIFGHERLSSAVRGSVNPLVSFSEVTWVLYRLILKPWRIVKDFFTSMGSQASGLKAHEKFILELLLALSVSSWLYFKLGYNSIWFPVFGEVFVGWLYIIWVALLMVGFASAFGLTDGLDGLSGGTHTLAFLAYGVIAFSLQLYPVAWFCAIVVGAELAFLYFNIFPARVEMADCGTVPLGMAFALVGVLTHREIILPIIGLVFVLELTSSFVQVLAVRFFNRRLFLMAPLHHHFEKLGWIETKVTTRLWWLAVLSALIGIMIAL